jgi:adenylyltransferase/sulfurtransferase
MNAKYLRQIALPGWGLEGQKRISESRVLIAGMGGLGSSLALMLAAAGTGTMVLMDGDFVEESNLARQFLFTEKNLGENKAEAAARFLHDRHPDVDVISIPQFLSVASPGLPEDLSFVFDCTDQISARYEIDQLSRERGLPWIHASIHQMQGQVAAFNLPLSNGARSASYSDFYPQSAQEIPIPDCSLAGVSPHFPAFLASCMAGEFFKFQTGMGPCLTNELLLINGLTMYIQKIRLHGKS